MLKESKEDIVEPLEITQDELLTVYTPEYLNSLKQESKPGTEDGQSILEEGSITASVTKEEDFVHMQTSHSASRLLPEVLDEFKPDMVIYNAGTDVLKGIPWITGYH